MGGTLGGQAKRLRDSTFTRFPIVFIFLSTFGLVSTLYGFEKVIDQITLFENNPLLILLTGILTLAVTGSLFKKLKLRTHLPKNSQRTLTVFSCKRKLLHTELHLRLPFNFNHV